MFILPEQLSEAQVQEIDEEQSVELVISEQLKAKLLKIICDNTMIIIELIWDILTFL